MTSEILIEASPFGVRALLRREGRPVKLIHHFAQRAEPSLGQLVWGRTGRRDNRLGGQVVDLGPSGQGLLQTKDRHYTEGKLILCAVRREGTGQKRPVLTDRPFIRFPAASVDPLSGTIKPGPMGEADLPPKAAIRPEKPASPGSVRAMPEPVRLLAAMAEAETDTVLCSSGRLAAEIRPFLPAHVAAERAEGLTGFLTEAEDHALERCEPLQGGGSFTVDETEALTAIDVDLGASGGQSAKGAGESLKRRLFDQLGASLSIRGIGGQVVLDLPRSAVRAPKVVRDQMTNALKQAGLVSIPAVTKEGLVVMILGRPRRSILEDLTEPFGEDLLRPGRRLRTDVRTWRIFDQALSAAEQDPVRPPRITLGSSERDCWEKACASNVFRERFGFEPVLKTVDGGQPE